jgi:hypothetical protein
MAIRNRCEAVNHQEAHVMLNTLQPNLAQFCETGIVMILYNLEGIQHFNRPYDYGS